MKLILLAFFTLLTFSYSFTQEKLNENGYNKIYYPNGSLQSEGTLVNGLPEGYWINYYPTGVKKSEGRRAKHQLDSIWIFYNIVGDTISKINYLNGKKNGYLIKFYQKPENSRGNIKSRELYVNDKIEGKAFYYYPDGSLDKEISYSDNKKEGFEYHFAEDGRITAIYTYRKGSVVERRRINRYNENGEKEGLWQEFYPGYRLKLENHFKNGLLDGYYKEYDITGKLSLTLLYRNGVLVDEIEEENIQSLEHKEYYADGSIKKTGFFIEDKPVGIHKEFDKSGNVTVSYIYNDKSELTEKGIIDNEGRRTGNWNLYYSDGSVKAKGRFKNNLKEGVWEYYFENGKIEQKGEFSRGNYNGLWQWYYPTGELWKEEEFYNGKEEGIYVEYDPFGNTIVEGEYFDGEREGRWKTIVNDYSAEGNYVTGLMDGKWKHYHDNGTLAFEGNYVQGNAEGKHRYYYSSGILKEEQYFNNGLREKHWKKYDEFGQLIITISYKNGVEYRINGIKIEFPRETSILIN